ncbi:hypothetical protein V5O48_001834 [Marasmius crinis-equi]|uniref:F-box domain-containing protein n=1 Tax=Marasmius crinis-equi TaxID=585013 RepID=A0ABR3FXC8_9AGAR
MAATITASLNLDTTDVDRLFTSTVVLPEVNGLLHTAETDLRRAIGVLNTYKVLTRTLSRTVLGLEERIRKLKLLTSPAYRLPEDILIRIFQMCLDEEPRVNIRPSITPTVFRLARICARWHDIVWDQPLLWSQFGISFQECETYCESLKRITDLFLARSRSHPLALTLMLPSPPASPSYIQTLESITQHSDRWLELYLDGASLLSGVPHIDLIQNRLSRLEVLTISGCPFSVMQSDFRLFESVPRLHTLAVEYFRSTAQNSHFPWHQIRRLRLHKIPLVDMLSIMRRCVMVEEITVAQTDYLHDGEVGVSRDLDSSLMVTLGEVKRLTVELHPGQEIPSVLKHSRMPTLSHLTLKGLGGVLESSWSGAAWTGAQSIREFLKRSACQPTSLTLEYIPVVHKDVQLLFRTMPELQALTLIDFLDRPGRTVAPIVLMDLVVLDERPPGSARPFLPALSHLSVGVHWSIPVVDTLEEICNTRWLPDPNRSREVARACLKSLDVRYIRPPAYCDLELDRLECYGSAGMRLTLVVDALEPIT